MDAIRVSDRDAADPKMLRRYLNALFEQNTDLLRRLSAAEQSLRSGTGTVGGLTEQERSLLRAIATGSPETPVSAQRAAIPTVSVKPPVNTSSNGDVIHLSTDNTIYRFDGTARDWIAIGAAAPSGMMTLNTAQVVDAAGVKTVQASWIFEVAQTLVNALDANLILLIQNTNAAGTSAAGVLRVAGSTSIGSLFGHGAARTIVRCGITLGNWVELVASAGLGLLIDTVGATPIVLGTNNAERARIDATGVQVTAGTLRFAPAASQIVPGATSLSLRDNANAADNVLVADNGDVTIRGDVVMDALNATEDSIITGGGTALIVNGTNAVGGVIVFDVKHSGSTVFEVTGDGDAHLINNLDVDADINVDGAAVIDGTLSAGGLSTLTGGLALATRSVSGDVTLAADDTLVSVNTNAARAISLPPTPASGQTHWIKDSAGTGAATNNITVSGNGNNIDGAATHVISTNRAGFLYAYDGSQWMLFG